MPALPLPAVADRGLPVAGRGPDLLCPVGLGVLTGEISPGMVDEVIERTGCREKRRRLRTAALFLLGYGWNLCFISGSAHLAP